MDIKKYADLAKRAENNNKQLTNIDHIILN